MIVYTYSHAVSYQRTHAEDSWPQAFWEVVENGGNSDSVQLSPARRRSLGRQQQALASMNSKKNKRRNSSSHGDIESTSRTTAHLIDPTTISRTQKVAAPSIMDFFNNNSTSAAIDVPSSHEEDSICKRTALESCSNNYLFRIPPSNLMELDSDSEGILGDGNFNFDDGGS